MQDGCGKKTGASIKKNSESKVLRLVQCKVDLLKVSFWICFGMVLDLFWYGFGSILE